MRIQLSFALLLAAVFACSMHAAPAQAQRVFVAATGSDGNLCTFAAPCRSFQHAHDVAPLGGEIDVLDPAGYGAVNITKSISIQGHGYAGIGVASGGTGITINAGPGDIVHVQGLLIDGSAVGTTGIQFNSGGSLTIQNCVVRNLLGAGIGNTPTTSAKITISNTIVSDNQADGIYVEPEGTNLTVNAFFNRVEAYNNGEDGIGIFSDHMAGLPGLFAMAVDSVSVNNAGDGFHCIGGATFSNLRLLRSAAVRNGLFGVSGGTQCGVNVAQSDLEGNIGGTGTGGIFTYQDNYTGGSSLGSILSKD
jgi:hypothetical protein